MLFRPKSSRQNIWYPIKVVDLDTNIKVWDKLYDIKIHDVIYTKKSLEFNEAYNQEKVWARLLEVDL